MLENYRTLAVFVAVTDAGGFSQAGRTLKLSTSVISHHIGRLEEKLGVSLFFRSTRSMSLTPEGRRLLEPARRMVTYGQEAMDTLAGFGEQPIGDLRLAMPSLGVDADIYQQVWTFANKYPRVTVTLHESDLQIDLVKNGFDLALRLNDSTDGSFKSCKVGDFKSVLVAAPDYLRNRSTLRTPDDLSSNQFIAVAIFPGAITLEKDQTAVEFVPKYTPIEVNSITAAKSAIVAGLGIQRLPEFEVRQELVSGTLVHVLPDWTPQALGVYAVWPSVGRQKKLTRSLIDFLLSANQTQ